MPAQASPFRYSAAGVFRQNFVVGSGVCIVPESKASHAVLRAVSPVSTEQEFIEEYRALVRSIAMKVRARYDLEVDLEDLMADGFTGLIEAKSRFDPGRGVQFNTYAYYRIRGAILDGVRKHSFLPRRAYEQLRAAEAALSLGEAVGEARAADPGSRTDVSKTVEALHQTISRLSASFVIASLGQDESSHESAEEMLLRGESAVRVRQALEQLPEREQALLKGHYLEGRRFDLVAKELGISKSWASRLHTKALDRLRTLLTKSA